MYKILGVSLILFFLPVCASFGITYQTQGFEFGGDNGVVLGGGPLGAAQNTNLAVINQAQSTTDPYHNVMALQTENGTLSQGAYAVGMDGIFGVSQMGNVLGGQLQAAGGGLTLQDQIINAAFGQDVAKLGGIGAALGLQAATVIQAQIIVTPHGASTNAQYLGVNLADSASGM